MDEKELNKTMTLIQKDVDEFEIGAAGLGARIARIDINGDKELTKEEMMNILSPADTDGMYN